MSCGSKACTSNELLRPLGSAESVRWLSRALRILGAMIDETRRQQLWLELEKARQRGLLADLEDWQLRDLGLTRDQAKREMRKPFWK